jgi:hypothetical protein
MQHLERSGKMLLKIDDHIADEITVQNLLAALAINREQSQELLAKESDLETYESQDLADQLRTCRHLEHTIAYFLTAEEFERRVGKKYPE